MVIFFLPILEKPDMLMEFSLVTTVDSWANFLPKNTLSPLLENETGKEKLFLSNTVWLFNLQIVFFTVNSLFTLLQIYDSS